MLPMTATTTTKTMRAIAITMGNMDMTKTIAMKTIAIGMTVMSTEMKKMERSE